MPLPSSRIVVVKPGLFTRQELEEYESTILDNPGATEHDASKFLARFPRFLTAGGYGKLAREIVLHKPDGKAVYRVDFFRQKFGDEFWDIVELKSPSAILVSKVGKHWKFSSTINAALSQSRDYSDFLEEKLNRAELEKRYGIVAMRPNMLLVGGRDNSEIQPGELRRLRSRYGGTDVRSYDDLYRFAKESYQAALMVIPIFDGVFEEPFSPQLVEGFTINPERHFVGAFVEFNRLVELYTGKVLSKRVAHGFTPEQVKKAWYGSDWEQVRQYRDSLVHEQPSGSLEPDDLVVKMEQMLADFRSRPPVIRELGEQEVN